MILSPPHTMRAVAIAEPGGPEVLQLTEVPAPVPVISPSPTAQPMASAA